MQIPIKISIHSTYSAFSDDLETSGTSLGGGITACLKDEANETVISTNSEKSLGKDNSGNFTSSCGSPGFTDDKICNSSKNMHCVLYIKMH